MSEPSHLRGEGRLVELGGADGRETATVTSQVTLPVSSTVSSGSGVRTLEGSQLTRTTVTYDLGDGAVLSSSSTTTGQFRLIVAPPEGSVADPIEGALTVEVSSEITRQD
ncbi:hypothetical protein BH18ACT4_BH18ACT4_08340 [soil metagenome]